MDIGGIDQPREVTTHLWIASTNSLGECVNFPIGFSNQCIRVGAGLGKDRWHDCALLPK